MKTSKLLSVVAIMVALFGVVTLLPCIQHTRDTPASYVSGIQLRAIAVALHGYHDIYKKLPPASVRDRNGKPLYSWRVALLPFLEQNQLYHRFHLDEPWDSPHNQALLDPAPSCYALWSPDDPPGTTRYQVITGPGTAFEHPGLSLLRDFPDGPARTILVVEAGEPVPWSKPADFVYDPNGPLPKLGAGYSMPVRFLCYEVAHQRGFHASLGDASSRWFPDTMNEQTLRAFVTRNGGEP